MEILKNKWIRFFLIIIMIVLIINSNKDGREAIKYLKNTEQLKKDISYTLSKTREVVAVSRMTKEEIAEYYIQKQKEQEKLEKEKLAREAEKNEKKAQHTKLNKNVEEVAKLSTLMKTEGNGDIVSKENLTKANQNEKSVSDEERLFDKVYIAEKYGPLKEIKTRMIECGDYVRLEYMIYEDNKPILDKKMEIYLLIGSDILTDLEKIVNGMYLNQKKKIDIATRENYSKSGKYIETKKIVQEINILSIEEVTKKELLNCN